MPLNIRTWNMNYWKKRNGNTSKTAKEKNEWLNYANEIIIKDKHFHIQLLQECSFNIFNNIECKITEINNNNKLIETSNNIFYYHTNPYKYPDWGNLSKFPKIPIQLIDSNNTLTYYFYKLKIKDFEFIIGNIHAQKDYQTKTYTESLIKINENIKKIINNYPNIPFIICGDFNASAFFYSIEKHNFIKIFTDLEKIGLYDCTQNIVNPEERSTMIDYKFQNDYVFINKEDNERIAELRIRKDIDNRTIDHFPIDFLLVND